MGDGHAPPLQKIFFTPTSLPQKNNAKWCICYNFPSLCLLPPPPPTHPPKGVCGHFGLFGGGGFGVID